MRNTAAVKRARKRAVFKITTACLANTVRRLTPASTTLMDSTPEDFLYFRRCHPIFSLPAPRSAPQVVVASLTFSTLMLIQLAMKQRRSGHQQLPFEGNDRVRCSLLGSALGTLPVFIYKLKSPS